MRGAPGWKRGRIDTDTHDRMPVGLETFLHLFSNFSPLDPGARHCIAIVENSQRCRIIDLVNPIGANRGKRFFIYVGHGVATFAS